MSNPIKDIQYSDKTNCKFSEAVYQKMITKRYGIKNCCEIDGERYAIDKELLDLNNVMNMPVTRTVCPVTPETDCVISCLNFTGICPTSYQNLYVLLSQGQTRFTFYDVINQYATLWPNMYADIHARAPSFFEPGCASNYPYELAAAWYWINNRISTTPAEDAAAIDLYNLIASEFAAFGVLAEDFYAESTIWQSTDYSTAAIPTALADIKINYTTCSGTVLSLTFAQAITIYRNGTIPITYTSDILAASPYGYLLDLNTYLTTQFIVDNTGCCTCSLPGRVSYMENYQSFSWQNFDLLTENPTDADMLYFADPAFVETTEVNYRQWRDAFTKTQNEYYLSVWNGWAAPCELLLPPLLAGDRYASGLENEQSYNFKILATSTCRCKGYTLNIKQSVATIADLPMTGNSNFDLREVIDDGPPYHYSTWFIWQTTTNSWVNENSIPEVMDCWTPHRRRRDAYLKALNEFILATQPMTWGAYYLPKFQITKFKL